MWPNYLLAAVMILSTWRLARDTLIGQDGSDTYKWAAGDGNDTIDEYKASGTDSLNWSDWVQW